MRPVKLKNPSPRTPIDNAAFANVVGLVAYVNPPTTLVACVDPSTRMLNAEVIGVVDMLV